MSQSVLVTIPDELVEDFINHLGRMKPDKAKHISIRVLDNDISVPEIRYMSPELVAMQNQALEDSKLGLLLDFPVDIPDDEWDDDILPAEDLLDHTGAHNQQYLPPYDDSGFFGTN